MWTTYKKEIIEREKQEKDFLKKYHKHLAIEEHVDMSPKHHAGDGDQDGVASSEAAEGTQPPTMTSEDVVFEEDDWPVQVRTE